MVESLLSFATPLVAVLTVVLVISTWVKSERVGSAVGVLILGFAAILFMSMLETRRLGEGMVGIFDTLLPSGSNEPSEKATPTPAPSEDPSPAPEAPASDWGEIWMSMAVGAVGLLVLILAIWLATTLVRRSKVKHREFVEAREKAQAEKARHEALLAKIASIWDTATGKHDELNAQYLSYQKDLSLIAKFPLMTDPSVPLTAKAVRAMTVADNHRPASAPREMEEVEKYRKEVTSFQLALNAAISNAKREGIKHFSEKEQKDLGQVQDLLRMAEDRAGSPHERRSAYERAIKTLQGILGEVPEVALLEIEAKAGEDGIRLELTA